MIDWRGMPDEYRNQIVTGDARVLSERIPDESIDLVFCDPVYDRIDDYRWLAETAARVLKPGGALLVWSNGKWHYPNTKWLEQGGLVWRYDFGCVSETGPAPMYGRVIAKTNRLMWFDVDGASKMHGYLADGYLSRQWSNGGEWAWTKNPIFTRQAIEAFTLPQAIVFDPFCGRGTNCAIAGQERRNWIGFEHDPTTASLARRRVAETQPPLFVLQPAQAALPW